MSPTNSTTNIVLGDAMVPRGPEALRSSNAVFLQTGALEQKRRCLSDNDDCFVAYLIQRTSCYLEPVRNVRWANPTPLFSCVELSHQFNAKYCSLSRYIGKWPIIVASQRFAEFDFHWHEGPMVVFCAYFLSRQHIGSHYWAKVLFSNAYMQVLNAYMRYKKNVIPDCMLHKTIFKGFCAITTGDIA